MTEDVTAADAAVLSAADLKVTFPTDDGDVRAVRGVSFTLGRGETIGVVGESGSGKSTIALAMLGLLPRSARVTGSVRCQGKELIGQPEKDLTKIRSSTIAYIPQDPLTSLNPAFTVAGRSPRPSGPAATWTRKKRTRRPSSCSSSSGSRTRRAAWTTSRTSSPAASGSGS